jgi:hypothetical protein
MNVKYLLIQTESNNFFFESLLHTDNSLLNNSKPNKIDNSFTPIHKEKTKQTQKFFNTMKSKELPPTNLKVNVIENTSLSQCKSNFSSKNVKFNKRNSERHFNYKYSFLTVVLII